MYGVGEGGRSISQDEMVGDRDVGVLFMRCTRRLTVNEMLNTKHQLPMNLQRESVGSAWGDCNILEEPIWVVV